MQQRPSATPEELFKQAQQAERAGKLPRALAMYEDVVKRAPRWAPGFFGLGSAQLAAGQHDLAKTNLEKAISIDGRRAAFHVRLAELHLRDGLAEPALAAAEAGLRLDPKLTQGLVVKASVLRMVGDQPAAIAALEPAIRAGAKYPGLSILYATLIAGQDRTDEAIDILEQVAAKPETDPQSRAEAGFALARMLERTGDYDGAFAAATDANAARARPEDAPHLERLHQERRTLWSAERMRQLARSRSRSEVPVFVVGMPRSGTSLVEHIIASHPNGAGAGEMPTVPAAIVESIAPTEMEPSRQGRLDALTPAALDRLGRKILRRMGRACGDPKAKRISDKMPQNFLNIGFIEQLFPKARIVHCVRSPLDTCLSCFFLDFGAAHNLSFTYDLAQLGVAYRLYREMMNHWKEASQIPILDVVYEDMINDQENQIRRLIDFVGLEWDDACLTPHKTKRPVVTHSTDQVRKPMYSSSIDRWRRFESHLGPLREALGPEYA